MSLIILTIVFFIAAAIGIWAALAFFSAMIQSGGPRALLAHWFAAWRNDETKQDGDN